MLFRLTIPRDVHLVPAVRQVAERVAQCAGYTAADAVLIASSVGQALDVVLSQSPSGDDEQGIDILFEREDVHLSVCLRYPAGDADPRSAVLDQAVSNEAMRQGMDSVEFGREGKIACCRLRRVLPREKVDHLCEIPPDAR